MSFSMSLSSCGEDADALIENKGRARVTDGISSSNDDDDDDEMHHYHHALEFNLDYFWPVEHPMEPQDEDRPVKCPMPTSSVINDGGRMSEERLIGERMRSRRDDHQAAAIANCNGIEVMARQMSPVDVQVPVPFPVRAVRKRQHTLLTQQGDDLMISPFARTRMPPSPSHNVTIFQML